MDYNDIRSKKTPCLSHGWQFYGRIVEGFFILRWKVFDLVGNCCVSDNGHGKQRLILTYRAYCGIKRRQTYSCCRVWVFYLFSLDIHFFFFLNYFLICLSKRRPLTWEFIQKYKENYECRMPHIQQESILQKHKSSC